MERLTIKNGKDIYALDIEANNDLDAKKILMDMFKVACNKLGKLEDLEEQKGMPLESYFKKLEKENSNLNKYIDHKLKEYLFFTKNHVNIILAMEKAIDKACEQLEKYSNYIENEDMTKEQWKEWCLKNE